jgi:hypothetical protein
MRTREASCLVIGCRTRIVASHYWPPYERCDATRPPLSSTSRRPRPLPPRRVDSAVVLGWGLEPRRRFDAVMALGDGTVPHIRSWSSCPLHDQISSSVPVFRGAPSRSPRTHRTNAVTERRSSEPVIDKVLKKIPCPLQQLDRHHVPMLVALRCAHSSPSGLRSAAARLLTLIGWLATGYPPRTDLNSRSALRSPPMDPVSEEAVSFEFGRFRPCRSAAKVALPFGRGFAAPKEVIITARKRIREPGTAAFRISQRTRYERLQGLRPQSMPAT